MDLFLNAAKCSLEKEKNGIVSLAIKFILLSDVSVPVKAYCWVISEMHFRQILLIGIINAKWLLLSIASIVN